MPLTDHGRNWLIANRINTAHTLDDLKKVMSNLSDMSMSDPAIIDAIREQRIALMRLETRRGRG